MLQETVKLRMMCFDSQLLPIKLYHPKFAIGWVGK